MLTAKPNLVQRHPLWSFFILTYALNILVTLIHLYVVQLPTPVLIALQAYTPTIGALVCSALIGGWAEIRKLLSGFTRWNIHWGWYIAALSLAWIPLLIAVIYIVLGNAPIGIQAETTPLILLSALISNLVLSGPLGEEAGWRGFALPRLLQRTNALTASVLLGIVWACWHIPFYAAPGHSIPFFIFVPLTIVLSIFFTWLYVNSGGSLILTVMAHYAFNFSGIFISGYFGLIPPMVLQISGGIGITLLTIAIVFIYGAKYLTRKQSLKLHVSQPTPAVSSK
ncbi:MAG: CPBP family intramembrane metalloprotease [Anaerolineae bacterium]|nr:CPBP family intramembrane metalloprotease [Anaerolineae bacterium]